MATHEPKLGRVTGTPFSVKCRHCGGWMGAGDGREAVADFGGEPWHAYFHGDSSHDCASHAGEYPSGSSEPVGFRHQTNG